MDRLSRKFSLALTCLLLASLVVTTVPATAVASSLTPKNRVIRWSGDRTTGSVRDPSECDSSCRSFYFSVNVPRKYWRSHRGSLTVRIRWTQREDDFDLYLYRAGQLIRSSQRRGSLIERVSLRKPKPATYRVIVVPVRVTDSGYYGSARLRARQHKPYRVPRSIASDCSRDVTAKLNAWFASLPADNAFLNFDAGACYRIERSLRIADRTRWTVDGHGATFRAFKPGPRYPKLRDHWVVSGGTDIVLRNFTIIGADRTPGTFDKAHEGESGIRLPNPPSRRVLIENVSIRKVYGDFITVGGHGGFPHRAITIRGGAHFGAGRQGVAVTDAIGVTIEGGRYVKIAASVFDLEPCGPCGDQIEGINIRGNTVARFGHLLVPASGTGHPPKNNVVIERNVVRGRVGDRHPNGPGSSWPLIDAYGAGSGWVIRNNVFARFEGAAIRFAGGTDTLIACNKIRWIWGTGRQAVTVKGGTTVIVDNRFMGARAVWGGTGDVFESGNALEDSELPQGCG